MCHLEKDEATVKLCISGVPWIIVTCGPAPSLELMLKLAEYTAVQSDLHPRKTHVMISAKLLANTLGFSSILIKKEQEVIGEFIDGKDVYVFANWFWKEPLFAMI